MIRNYKFKDREQVLKLHAEAFQAITGDEQYRIKLHEIKSHLDHNLALVDTVGHSVIGFSIYSPFWQNLAALQHIETALVVNHNRSSETVAKVKQWFEQRYSTSSLGFYQDFPIHHHQPQLQDIYINSLAVMPVFQNQGCGKELLEKTVERAATERAKAVYLHTYGDRENLGLFYHAEFRPIIFWGPLYPDGQPGKVMGRLIEK